MPLRGGICSFSSLIGGTGRIRRHTRSFIRQSRSIIRFRGRRIRRGSGIIGRFTQKGKRSTHQLTAAKGGETFDIVKGADLHKFINALALGLIAFRISCFSAFVMANPPLPFYLFHYLGITARSKTGNSFLYQNRILRCQIHIRIGTHNPHAKTVSM